jgi:hypothetical protein
VRYEAEATVRTIFACDCPAERRTPNAERRTPNAERRTPNAERRTPNAERHYGVSGLPRLMVLASTPIRLLGSSRDGVASRGTGRGGDGEEKARSG